MRGRRSLKHGCRGFATSGGATGATGIASGFELAVTLCPDGLLAPGEEVVRGDVADGAVQADAVVVLDEPSDYRPCLGQGGRRSRTDGVALDGLMVTLELAVRLRVVGCGSDVGHASQADELLEVLRDELRAVVGDDARPSPGVKLAAALQDDLDVLLGHGLADVPVDDGPAGTVENRAQVVEGPSDVEV